MDECHANRVRLQQFVENEGDALRKTLRYYVLRAGLASGQALHTAADELLNEIMVEALKTPERLKADIHPRPWLLGIASNLIKRQQAKRAKLERREPLMRDLYPQQEDTLSDEELFDQLPALTDSSLADVEVKEEIATLLSGLSPGETHILRLAILYDMDGETLGTALGVTANAARVRLHRALNRLRSLRQKDTAHE
jgi:RNA polymerase sigma factor (sigma-70 family)